MEFYRRHWYLVGGALFVALAFAVAIWGAAMDPLRRILLLSFMALLVHQFEEYAVPGGFPAVFNIGWNREVEAPARYPLNQGSALVVNVFAGYPFYLLPVVFPTAVWLGLGQILFGMAGQLVLHGVVINRKLRTAYNPGLGSVVLLHVPVGIYYISYITAHGLASPAQWVEGVLCTALASVLVVLLPINLLKRRDSPHAFSPEEMGRGRPWLTPAARS